MMNDNSNCQDYRRIPVALYMGSIWWQGAWQIIKYFSFLLSYLSFVQHLFSCKIGCSSFKCYILKLCVVCMCECDKSQVSEDKKTGDVLVNLNIFYSECKKLKFSVCKLMFITYKHCFGLIMYNLRLVCLMKQYASMLMWWRYNL